MNSTESLRSTQVTTPFPERSVVSVAAESPHPTGLPDEVTGRAEPAPSAGRPSTGSRSGCERVAATPWRAPGRPWLTAALVLLLLASFALQAVSALRSKFTTFDEAFYLAGGYSYLVTGDTRMVNRFHPPLAQVLVALPLLPLDLKQPEADPNWSAAPGDLSTRNFSLNFLYQNRVPWQTILFRGRLMMVGFAVVVGLVVFAWAAELGGRLAGLLALAFYAFSPNLLAHAELTTTDLPVAGLAFAACYFLWRFYRRPSLPGLLLTGLVFGLALVTKLSALIFAPILVLLSALYVVTPPQNGTAGGPELPQQPGRSPGRAWSGRLALAALSLVIIAGLATAVIWLAYLGASSAGTKADFIAACWKSLTGSPAVSSGSPANLMSRLWATATPLIPCPKEYWELLAWLLAKSRTGHHAFLLGQLSQKGWWCFFPLTFAVKTPLATLILVGVALACGWTRQNLFDRLFLLLPPLAFLGVSMCSRINIGYRHILPMLPFLLVFGSQLASRPWPAAGRRYARVALLSGLLAWHVAGTLRVAPHHLAFFNELVGGPGQGYKYLVDSNLDWGQDLLGLADYLHEQHVDQVKLAYFGLVTPEVIRSLGINFEPVTSREEAEPSPGVYAISATYLQGPYGSGFLGGEGPPFTWLRRLEPQAVIGYTIFVYRVTDADVAKLEEERR